MLNAANNGHLYHENTTAVLSIIQCIALYYINLPHPIIFKNMNCSYKSRSNCDIQENIFTEISYRTGIGATKSNLTFGQNLLPF